VHRFACVNNGDNAVEISAARASCGCLAPRLTRRSLKPGEEGVVELEVNTLSQGPGPHTWTVNVSYQSGDGAREVALQLHARLIQEVMVQPAAVVVLAGNATHHDVTIADLRSRPFTIKEVSATGLPLQTKVSGPERDSEGHRVYRVTMTTGDQVAEGRHSGTLHVYTDDPDYADLTVAVTLVKRSQQRLTALPSEVSLTAAAGQTPSSRIVLLRDTYGAAVRVEKVTADDPAITCRWAAGPNSLATLKVQLDPTRLHGGSLRSAVHVDVREPIRTTLTIPVAYTPR
jgi:hypothetical protein